jgi:hypothetical protein
MPTSKIKGLDEQTLEGGVGSGAGGRSGVTSSNSKLDNVFGIEGKAFGKQFEKQSPTAEKAQAKIDKVNSERKAPKEVTNYFEMTDAQRANLTPAQLRRLGSDATHSRPGSLKTGGTVTASRRADGIAMRGKTRGKMC